MKTVKIIFVKKRNSYKMWKLGVVAFIFVVGSTFGQNIIINCHFGDYGLGGLYMCSLSRITVLDPSSNITFNGTHTGNRSDTDVDLVEIYDSNTPFVIHQLFTTFPNLRFLNIYDSNLETIVIPPASRLVQLVIQGNKVTKIESNSFRNQTQLLYLLVTHSGVTDIDEDAFEDLHAVQQFSLWNNTIEKLTPRLLAPLKNVEMMTFRNNLISKIDGDIFLHNTKLEYLEFTDNRIDQIHPRAFTSLRNSLSSLYLNGNQCVSQVFSLQNDADWIAMDNALERCFRNTPALRNVTMEFSGSMTIFDESGNIIARF